MQAPGERGVALRPRPWSMATTLPAPVWEIYRLHHDSGAENVAVARARICVMRLFPGIGGTSRRSAEASALPVLRVGGSGYRHRRTCIS